MRPENGLDENAALLRYGDNVTSSDLLVGYGTRARGNSESFIARGRSNTINSIKSSYETVKKHKTQFFLIVLASVIIYSTFILVFLPRTSLSRDFRRFHLSKLTKDEAYRIYISTLLDDNKIKEHLGNYSSTRVWAGDQNSLRYTIDELTSLGFNPLRQAYYPWVNTPVLTSVTLWENGKLTYNASMMEEKLIEDPSSDNPEGFPAFHGYSADGNVSSRYVFCNYGTIEDYKFMQDNGIDIENKIHILRYGNLHTGLKVRNAETYGAIAVIVYTDSYDDGRVTEAHGYESYPDGPARHESSIQRDSVLYLSEIPGDPTTPGYIPKRPDTDRLLPDGRIPTIPSVPLSEKEITPILEKLNNKGTKIGRGGSVKGFEYYTGPSDSNVHVHVVNKQKYDAKKIVDVSVEIPGIFKDSEVIIGSHRDSWGTGGAAHAGSGSAILLHIAKGLSALRKKGWKPLRTIKLVSWDGEAQGMLGSTAYGVENKAELDQKALVYFNLDSAISGNLFKCNSHPLLRSLFLEAAKYTLYNGKAGYTLYDHWKQQSNLIIGGPDSSPSLTVFQHHLGVPSADFKFASDGKFDAIYQRHSIYDSQHWLEKFLDPNYELHNTLATFAGISALILVENESLPFETASYMELIWKRYAELYEMTKDTFPNNEDTDPLLDALMDQLELAAFSTSKSFDKFTRSLKKDSVLDYPWWKFYKKIKIYMKLLTTNKKMQLIDRIFLHQVGLTGRPWMKHSVFAPNKQVGCIGDILPGLHEALLAKDIQETIKWLRILSTDIDRMISLLTV
ncbi:HGL245Cp [Eremothecium sinecaudum]|uniref:HGL245Cp n=1 Tax=Eremothecium sinecaudum TaxID=45286 RepID=A0A120K2N5_9SACH|nr:HGL245Cp [Eremothecium sinecaudum]AMD22095.1 HGL245Cp [Eremothecium sinecaudum]